ncbi:DUF551 domain-containing protein [Klebsiella pneumoniae]|uniref:DUF551 domain-containing protein n=1 Tax=Klebsiella pneumoniae TaxID=573 RepID=UPI000E2A840B|nr:Eaa1 [Klebsiella pneumoniae]
MTSKLTRERIELIANFHRAMTLPPSHAEIEELARMALAAMDSESGCLPLDYLQGHKDGLEWAAQLAEANHPETGDWLYDDPIELSKAIRKGPDMPPAQPVADSEPVIVVGDDGGDALSYRRLIQSFEPGTKLYRHAQPALVIPDEMTPEQAYEIGDYHGDPVDVFARGANWMRQHIIDSTLAAARQSPGSEPATVPGKWIPVSERMPENDGAYLCWDNRYVTTYAFIFGAWQANQFVAKNITHWMPLPNPPKE